MICQYTTHKPWNTTGAIHFSECSGVPFLFIMRKYNKQKTGTKSYLNV